MGLTILDAILDEFLLRVLYFTATIGELIFVFLNIPDDPERKQAQHASV